MLQLTNDDELQIFNGDLGTILAVEPEEQVLEITPEDGRLISHPFASLHALTHAYAMSVHKAQGSEFPAVVIVLLMHHAPMLGRTLLYTAFTRARQLVVLVGQRRALAFAVKNWRRTPRHTALAGLLQGTRTFTWPHQQSAEAAGEERAHWDGLTGGAADVEDGGTSLRPVHRSS